MKVLVVEDEHNLAEILKEGLELHKFSVDTAHDGSEGLRRGLEQAHDLILLDVMLPKKDGFEVCRSLRENGVETPIMFLTARELVKDRVSALNMGADDYMIKPYNLEELIARLKALLRRQRTITNDVLKAREIELNTNTHTVRKSGKKVDLTTTEFNLLEFFMKHPNHVFSRDQILHHIRDLEYFSSSNIVEVYMTYLRKKLGDQKKTLIETVPGLGYKFVTTKEQ